MRTADRPPSANPSHQPPRARLHPSIAIVGGQRPQSDRLIRRLALDRLRDLHDDGVTMDYIGRMYDVSGERIAALERDLRGDR